jgi:hypothetical protein
MIMKTACLLLAGLMFAATAHAQNMYRAVQQAHRAADQTTARSGGGQPPAPNTPSVPPAPPVDPAVTAALQNIAGIRASLTAINAAADAGAASEHRIALLNQLSSAAQGQKASSATVRKFAGDLIQSLAGKKKLSAENSEKLARNLRALFNAKHLGGNQQETLVAEVKKILTDAGAADADVTKIADDLNTIATETR